MLSRRNFIKKSLLCSSATTFYFSLPKNMQAENLKQNIIWDKSICKFCSIGCGILVGSSYINYSKKIVSIKGDINSPVNKGLLCEKAYYNGDVLYSKDRLTNPLLRMKDGKYDKNGKFEKISWEKAFDIMESKAKYALKESGADGVGVFTSGMSNIYI